METVDSFDSYMMSLLENDFYMEYMASNNLLEEDVCYNRILDGRDLYDYDTDEMKTISFIITKNHQCELSERLFEFYEFVYPDGISTYSIINRSKSSPLKIAKQVNNLKKFSIIKKPNCESHLPDRITSNMCKMSILHESNWASNIDKFIYLNEIHDKDELLFLEILRSKIISYDWDEEFYTKSQISSLKIQTFYRGRLAKKEVDLLRLRPDNMFGEYKESRIKRFKIDTTKFDL